MPHRRVAKRIWTSILKFTDSISSEAYLAVILVASVAFFVQSGLIAYQQHRTNQLARQGVNLAKEIQDQRRDITKSNCEDQNARHALTLEKLHNIIDESKIPANIKPSVFNQNKTLIDALAPPRDCNKLVNQTAPQVNGKK